MSTTKQRRRVTLALSALMLIATSAFTGCAPEGEHMTDSCTQHQRDTGRGDDQPVSVLYKEFATRCGLTDEDLYMVDLPSFLRRNNTEGKTGDEIRRMLADHRERVGDSLLFLEDNPAFNRPVADYTQLRYVFLSLNVSGPRHEGQTRNEILVDMRLGTIHWASGASLLLNNLPASQSTALPDQAKAGVVASVELTRNWTQSKEGTTNGDWEETEYQSWALAFCMNDYSLHRFESSGVDAKEPAEFPDFVNQFLAAVGLPELAR